MNNDLTNEGEIENNDSLLNEISNTEYTPNNCYNNDDNDYHHIDLVELERNKLHKIVCQQLDSEKEKNSQLSYENSVLKDENYNLKIYLTSCIGLLISSSAFILYKSIISKSFTRYVDSYY